MTKYIIIKTQFEALHCWPDCPYEDVEFLKNSHRHIFYVTVKFKINQTLIDIFFTSLLNSK